MRKFDPEFAKFLLVAGVVACIMMMAMASVGMCALYFGDIVAGKFRCDPDDRIMRALDLVIGFVMGMAGAQVIQRK